MAAHGGAWGRATTTPAELAAVFELLDRRIGSEDFLADMAFVGSPGLVLTGYPGAWRLGWFEASLVSHLEPAIDAMEDEIAADIGAAGPTAGAVLEQFRDALEEARARGFAVAILHGP